MTEFLETSVISYVQQKCTGPTLTGMLEYRQPVCKEEVFAMVKIYE